MIQVTMYQCEYCKKYFKTPDKHRCKYDPKFKNCFSCKHNKGFDSDYINSEYTKEVFPICDKGWEWGMGEIITMKYDLQCEDHEFCGRWFENEHNKNKESI